MCFVERHNPAFDILILYKDRKTFLEQATSRILVDERAA